MIKTRPPKQDKEPENNPLDDTEEQYFIPTTDDEGYEFYSEDWVIQGLGVIVDKS